MGAEGKLMPKLRYTPLPKSDELSEPLRQALNSNFEAILEECYDARGHGIEMRDQCVRIADSATARLDRDISSAVLPAADTLPPMRDKAITLSEHIELKLEESEVRKDAALYRQFRNAVRGGFWDGVRKVVGLILFAAAVWIAAKLHSSWAEHQQSTVAPASK